MDPIPVLSYASTVLPYAILVPHHTRCIFSLPYDVFSPAIRHLSTAMRYRSSAHCAAPYAISELAYAIAVLRYAIAVLPYTIPVLPCAVSVPHSARYLRTAYCTATCAMLCAMGLRETYEVMYKAFVVLANKCLLCTEVAYAKREVVLRQRFRGTEIGSARRAAVLSKGMQEEKKFEEKLCDVRY
eukprot:1855638-Rhodomonas_salina.2